MRTLLVRANPLALLVVGIVPVLGSVAVRAPETGLTVLGVYLALFVLTTNSLRHLVLTALLAGFAGLTVAWSTWRGGGQDVGEAVTAGLRILVLAWPGAVVAGYVDPTRLGDYLAQNLRLPARPVVAVTAALQQVADIGDRWQQVARSRQARGVGPSGGLIARSRYLASMVAGLLIGTLRGVTGRAVAMDARGFATAQRRTWAEPAPWSRLDVAVAVVGAVVGLLPVTQII